MSRHINPFSDAHQATAPLTDTRPETLQNLVASAWVAPGAALECAAAAVRQPSLQTVGIQLITLVRFNKMLKEIVIITITMANLNGMDVAYRDYLGYELIEHAAVSTELAALWSAPAMAGQPSMILQPSNEAPVYLRFVEDEPVADYAPMTSWGWNATEILVADPDGLADRLANSPFKVIGPPKDLWAAPDAPRALQALGPGNEVLYLTSNPRMERVFGLTANYGIERVFIMVVGGPSMDALRGFYADTLGAPSEAATPFQISVIANANGLDPETTFPLAVAAIAPGYLIELDEYPPTIGARASNIGHLPSGIAVVAFTAEGLDPAKPDWRSAPRRMAEFPYDGRSVGVTVGPAGEWIELIDTPAPSE